MFPAETTSVVIFMLATAAQTVFGLYLFGFGAHCFLVVLEETGAGNDEVRWPDVPVMDWLWKMFYLAWLIAFWAVPAWLVVGVLGPALVEQSRIPFVFFLVGVVWLVFPISLFSSLSANSRWVVFRPEVLRRLAHHGPAMMLVYLVTGVLVIGWALLAYYTLTQRLVLLPVTALAGPAVLLIDARLLGRMAWLLNYRTPERRRRRKPKKLAPGERAVAVDDPWALTPEMEAEARAAQARRDLAALDQIASSSAQDDREEDEFEDVEEAEDVDFLPVKGYGLAKDQPPPQPPASLHLGEIEPVGVKAEPDGAAQTDKSGKPEHPGAKLGEVSRFEAELAAPSPEPTPPARPLWSGVYQFPWYPQTAGAWLIMAFLTLAMGALAKIQMETWAF